MRNSFKVAEIAYGNSKWSEVYDFKMGKYHFEIHRIGVDSDFDHAKNLIKSVRSDVDAIAISEIPNTIFYNNRTYIHRQFFDLINVPSSTLICEGRTLRELLLMNRLVKSVKTKEFDPSKGVFFTSGLLYSFIVKELRKKYDEHLYFGDPFFTLGLPIVSDAKNVDYLARLFMYAANIADIKTLMGKRNKKIGPISRKLLEDKVNSCENIFLNASLLLNLKDPTLFIKDKVLVFPTAIGSTTAELLKYKPKKIVDLFPEEYKFSEYISFSVLDACLKLKHNLNTALNLKGWENLLGEQTDITDSSRSYISLSKPSAQMKLNSKLKKIKNVVAGERSKFDFAFIVHALSQEDIFRAPGLRFLNHFPKAVTNKVEKAVSTLPGVKYGTITNIVSEKSGREVNGIIYGLFSTPKEMKGAAPEVIYNKINKLCLDAKGKGAKIIGLGAYTKVVGDSGFTINRNSPIPVTTGNSLSASATLWSAREAIEDLGFVSYDPNTKQIIGTAMVIGATGSIGRVSARLLAISFKRLVIMAPNKIKLSRLKQEIEKEAPHCEVIVCTSANEWASSCELIVTATSAFDQKIVDIELIKPGAVVCDCSRPLDFSAEDAMKRPDVLIIESGELVLPGPYTMTCDLGLPGKTVYACLAETALLSLENRNESFTLGRNIELDKVKEIYRLCLKHGVKLADIQSHTGTVTKKEIAHIKKIATERLKNWDCG